MVSAIPANKAPQSSADAEAGVDGPLGGDFLRMYVEAIIEHGGLFNQPEAAKIAGVTQQRISQLVQSKRLPLLTLTLDTPGGPLVLEELISGNELQRWMASSKGKPGRPRKQSAAQELAVAA